MFYLIGIGLHSEKDITLRGLEAIKASDHVFLEHYTSKTSINLENFQKLVNKEIKLASREFLESTDELIELSKNGIVSLLIIGTPLFATTHTDILIRAKENNIDVKVIHNSSIMNVMGCYGLFSYSFGKTVSIPFFDEKWKPTSFYDRIKMNYGNGLHTLCLLDLKVKEVKPGMVFSENKEYDEEKYMTPNVAIEQLIFCEKELKCDLFNNDYKFFVISRFGCDNEAVFYDSYENLKDLDFGGPLHSLILPGKMEIIEKEHVEYFFENK